MLPNPHESVPATTDDPLVQRAIAGDPDAFDTLVERHWKGIFRLAAASLPSIEDARDLAQDTFVAAWEGRAAHKTTHDFKSWLYGICRNKIRNVYRNARKTRMTPVDTLVLEHIDTRTSVDPDAVSAMHAALAACLRSLPPEMAAIIEERYVRNIPVQEMAALRQMTPGAVSKLLWRTRQSLADCITKRMHKEEPPARG